MNVCMYGDACGDQRGDNFRSQSSPSNMYVPRTKMQVRLGGKWPALLSPLHSS